MIWELVINQSQVSILQKEIWFFDLWMYKLINWKIPGCQTI